MGKLSNVSKLLFDRGVKSTPAKESGGFFSKVFKTDEDGIPTGFGWRGKAAIIGIGMASVANDNVDAYNRDRLGTADGRIYTNTPSFQPYLKMKAPPAAPRSAPAGADGSLVFALDRTKNGGFL